MKECEWLHTEGSRLPVARLCAESGGLLLWVVMLMLLSGVSLAARPYQANLDESAWAVDSSIFECWQVCSTFCWKTGALVTCSRIL